MNVVFYLLSDRAKNLLILERLDFFVKGNDRNNGPVSGDSYAANMSKNLVHKLLKYENKNKNPILRNNFVNYEINDIDYFENKNNLAKYGPDYMNNPLQQKDGKENIFSIPIKADKTDNNEKILPIYKKDSEKKIFNTEMGNGQKKRCDKVDIHEKYLNQNKNNSYNNCFEDFRLKKDVNKNHTIKKSFSIKKALFIILKIKLTKN